MRTVSLPAWSRYLLPGLVAALLVLPVRGAAGTYLFNAVQLTGVGAAMVGLHRHRPATAGAWRLMALGFGLAIVADLAWVAVPRWSGREPFLTAVGVLLRGRTRRDVAGHAGPRPDPRRAAAGHAEPWPDPPGRGRTRRDAA